MAEWTNVPVLKTGVVERLPRVRIPPSPIIFVSHTTFFFKIHYINMAVPKKRKSKSKTKIRKFTWKKKALDEAKKSIALSKALLKENPTRFIYND